MEVRILEKDGEFHPQYRWPGFWFAFTRDYSPYGRVRFETYRAALDFLEAKRRERRNSKKEVRVLTKFSI